MDAALLEVMFGDNVADAKLLTDPMARGGVAKQLTETVAKFLRTWNTITVPAHGFNNGDTVRYVVGTETVGILNNLAGRAIRGLNTTDSFRVVVVDADHVRLQTASGADTTFTGVGVGHVHQLRRTSDNRTVTFDPQSFVKLGPNPPRDLSAIVDFNGALSLNWAPPTVETRGDYALTGYRVYTSADGRNFNGGDFVSLANLADANAPQVTVNLTSQREQVRYFRVAAVNAGGESLPSAVVAARRPASSVGSLLIVDGFDRLDRLQGPVQTFVANRNVMRIDPLLSNSRNYAVQVAESIEKRNPDLRISTAPGGTSAIAQLNQRNVDGTPVYKALFWIAGEESKNSVRKQPSLEAAEIAAIQNYIQAGGHVFISGADLARDFSGNAADKATFDNALHAGFVKDDAGTYSTNSVVGSIFDGIDSIIFDGENDGNPASTFKLQYYNVDAPDVISTNGTSTVALNYIDKKLNVVGAAAIQRAGATLPAGTKEGNLVYLAFPFETIISAATTTQMSSQLNRDGVAKQILMDRVLTFFGIPKFKLPSLGPLSNIQVQPELNSIIAAVFDPTAVSMSPLAAGSPAAGSPDVGPITAGIQAVLDSLDQLDGETGNIQVVTNGSGGLVVDAFIKQAIKTTADMKVNKGSGSIANAIAIAGLAAIDATMEGKIRVGFDPQGAYIDTANSKVSIKNVIANAVNSVVGQIGSLDVSLIHGELHVDSSTAIDVSFTDPGQGAEADARIRATELTPDLSALLSASVNDNPSAEEVVFNGTFNANPTVNNGAPGFGLSNAELAMKWADAKTPESVEVTAPQTSQSGNDLLGFLDLKPADYLAAFSQIASVIEFTTGNDLLKQKLPLVGKSFGDLMNSASPPIDVAASNLQPIAETVRESGVGRFKFQMIQPPSQTIRVGDKVVVKNSARASFDAEVETVAFVEVPTTEVLTITEDLDDGPIVFVTRNELAIRVKFTGDGDVDRANPRLQIVPNRTLLEALKDRLKTAAEQAATSSFQTAIAALSGALGIDPQTLTVGIGGSGLNRALELGLNLPVGTFTFNEALDFGASIPGINLAAKGGLSIQIAPSLHLKTGIRFAPDVPLAERFYLVDDATPELSLVVTAQFDNPQLHASFGLLDLTLREQTLPVNDGVKVTGTLTVNLDEPGTGDGRITLADLQGESISNFLDAAIDARFDIDGLELVPGGALAGALGTIRLNLDGDAGGHVTNLAGLTNLPSAIVLTGLDEFLNFDNLSAFAIQSILQQLRGWLDDVHGSSVFATNLPLTSKTLGDAIDLGTAFFDSVVGVLDNPRLVADGLASVDGKLPEDVNLSFKVNDTINLDFSVLASQTTTNTSLEDLAADVRASLAFALTQAGLTNALDVGIRQGALTIFAKTDEIKGLAVSAGNSLIGFAKDQLADALGYRSLDEFFELLAQRLLGPLNPTYDAVASVLTFTLSFDESFTKSSSLDFGAGLGSLADVRISGGDVDIAANATGSLRVGINLCDVSKLQSCSLLSNLNVGQGVAIPPDSPSQINDLRITLRNGSTVNVNLNSSMTMLGEVLAAITSSSPFLTAQLDPATHGSIRLTDASTGSGTLSVSGAPGSDSAVDLGLIGSDVDGDGVFVGQTLHGLKIGTLLAKLNGGNGVVVAPDAPSLDDLRITLRDGTTVNVNLASSMTTLGEVLDAINAASPLSPSGERILSADIDPDTRQAIRLTDISTALAEAAADEAVTIAAEAQTAAEAAAAAADAAARAATQAAEEELAALSAFTTFSQTLHALISTGAPVETVLAFTQLVTTQLMIVTAAGDARAAAETAAASAAATAETLKVNATVKAVAAAEAQATAEAASGPLSVSGLPDSFAAMDLGLVGSDGDNDGVFIGHSLGGKTDSDRFFIDPANSKLGGSISLTASHVNANARIGFVDVSVNEGHGTASAGASVTLADPGTGAPDGRITLDELFDALANHPERLITSQVLTGSATFDLPIQINPAPLAPPGDPHLFVTMSNLFDPGTFAAAITPEFDLLSGLENFAFSQLIAGLRKVQTTLAGIENIELLQKRLPLIDTSLADMLEISKRFGRVIDKLELDQPRTLAQFETSFDAALQAEIAGTTLPDVSLSLSGGSFDINLTFGGGVNKSIPLNFDLVSLGGAVDNLISVETGGNLTLAANAAFNLGLTVDLTEPTSPQFFIKDTTGFTASASATGNNLSFDATVLVFNLLVRNGTANISGNWTVGLDDDPTDHRYELFNELSINDFSSSLTGAATANLPVDFQTVGNPLDPAHPAIVLNANLQTLLQGGTISLVVPDFAGRVSVLLADLRNNLGGLVGGWDGIFKLLDELVDGEVFGVPIPLVGDQLAQAASFLSQLRTEVTATLDSVTSQGVQPILNAFFNVLGPTGLKLLADINADNLITTADIPVISTPDRVEFDFQLHRDLTLVDTEVNFDSGIPALGLEVNGHVRTEVGFDFGFGIGFSKTEGVYLDVGRVNELAIGFRATIPKLSASGRLAFFQIDVQDDPTDPSIFDGSFTVDLVDPGLQAADGRLTLSELRGAPASSIIDARLTADADLNLPFVASIEGNAEFPSLRGELNIDWDFNSADPSEGIANFGGRPGVAFNNIQLDAGSFLTDFFGSSTLGKVQQVLRPLKPVIDALKFKIPALNVSVIDLAKRFGDARVQFLAAATDVANLVGNIPNIPGELLIPFGSFNLGTADIRGLTNLSGVIPVATNSVIPKQLLASLNPQASAFMAQAEGVTGGGFSFPIWDNPSSVMGLLMGKDIDLVRFDMAPLSLKTSKTFKIPIFPPLFAEFTGRAGVEIDFDFGFDTNGLRKFFDSGFDDFSAIANGFYVADTGADGKDKDEVTLNAALIGAGSINLAVVKAGIQAGIEAIIALNLDDPNSDGRVRFDELLANIRRSPRAIFGATGKLDVFAGPFLKFGVTLPFFGFKTLHEVDLPEFRKTLLDFDFDASGVNQPVLASIQQGELTLHMGPRAGDRQHGDTTDGDETFSVLPGALPNQVIVEAFGRTAEFEGVTKIIANGGLGNDSITIAPGVAVPVELTGGDGDDQLTVSLGAATLRGGAGNDTLEGGAADDQLFGEDGDDRLQSFGGNDRLEGGAGRDSLSAGGGNDTLLGGDGVDTLRGEDDADVIEGGDEGDQISGGAGADTVDGGAGNDLIEGLAGDDILSGGVGNDTILAGLGLDRLFGDDGDDQLAGDEDADVISGGLGNDRLDGGAGNDSLGGDDGNDSLIGGTGSDELRGGAGNDSIIAEADTTGGSTSSTHVVFGDAGSDTIYGGNGSDTIDGGADADSIFALGGNDLVHGGAANDVIDAGAGLDSVFGGDGDDTITGGLGADVVSGGLGNDTIVAGISAVGSESVGNTLDGNEGNDTITGDLGNDLINAGIGNDVAFALAGNDFVELGLGNDTAMGGAGDDTLRGGDGNDSLDGGDNNDLLVGGLGNDTLAGQAGEDVLWGDSEAVLRALLMAALALPTRFVDAEIANPTGYTPPSITPQLLIDATGIGLVSGINGDGDDLLNGGNDRDWLFGGAGDDNLDGAGGTDFVLAGFGDDSARGGDGDDVILGGADDDTVHGDGGIDQVYGDDWDDAGLTHGADSVFGDAGTSGVMAGQRLWGGGESDSLFAFAPTNVLADQGGSIGDELHGGDGNDLLQGNLRRELMFGDGGKDDLRGDILAGPVYALNTSAATIGAPDTLFGGSRRRAIAATGRRRRTTRRRRRWSSPISAPSRGSQDAGRITFTRTTIGDDVSLAISFVDDWELLGFADATQTADGRDVAFLQHFAFYQAKEDIERTVFDVRGGNDVVRADAGYKFPLPDGSGFIDSEWGIAQGDRQQGARIGALEIYGGAGADLLVGGRLDDIIDGGADKDYIAGGMGDDDLRGGSDDDFLYGNVTDDFPDRFEMVTRGGVSDQNDTNPFAAMLPELAADHAENGTLIAGLNFSPRDTDDWYILRTPYARNEFGELQRAFVTKDMIEVKNDLGLTIPAFDLFAAEDIDPSSELNVVVVEESTGVPEYYVMRINAAAGTRYSIKLLPELGRSIHVPTTTADEVASGRPSDRGTVIPLGDINGDGFPDTIVAVEDQKGGFLDGFSVTNTTLQRGDVIRPTLARVHFGGTGGGTQGPFANPVTLMLPAPLLASSIGDSQSFISVGRLNNDDIDDIVVSFVQGYDSPFEDSQGLGAYILFGSSDPARWAGTIDVIAQADVYIRANNVVTTANVNDDAFDDLLFARGGRPEDDFRDYTEIIFGRADWGNSCTVATAVGCVLFREDFNSGSAALIQNSTTIAGSTPGLWHRTTLRSGDVGHQGGHSLYFGQDATRNFNTGATAGWVTLPSIALTDPTLLGASLSFNYFLETDSATDKARVLVAVNGGAFAPLSLSGAPSTTPDADNTDRLLDPSGRWHRAVLDLRNYLGATIQIRFEFDAVTAAANTFEGWYLDDVVVRGFRHDPTRNANVQLTNGREVVSPPISATQEGNSSQANFGIGGGMVSQLFINPADLGINAGEVITGFHLRLDQTSPAFPASTAITWDRFEVKMGVGKGAAQLTTTFANNYVSPPALVRSGTLTMQPNFLPATGTPRDWSRFIALDTPFTYTGGILAIEIRTLVSGVPIGALVIDAHGAGSIVQNVGSNTATAANQAIATRNWVMKFDTVPSAQANALAVMQAASIGDFNGDGDEDFALLVEDRAGVLPASVQVFLGGAGKPFLAGGRAALLRDFEITLPHVTGGYRIKAAGNLNRQAGDAFDDFIIEGSYDYAVGFGADESFVVAGRSGLTGTHAIAGLSGVIHIDGLVRPAAAGDFNGDAIDDLAVERFIVTPKLNRFAGGSPVVYRQVGQVYLGAADFFTNPARLAAPDLVFESAEPVFNDVDEPVLRPYLFGASWVDTPPPGPANNRPSDLLMAEPLENKTRLYHGRTVPATEAPAAEPPRPYEYDLAIPAAAPSRLPGVNVNDPAATLRDGFALLGLNEDQLLGGTLDVGDINGDGFHDYLLQGQGVGYLLLGPLKLDSVESLLDQPLIVLDTASLGVPLSRGGDVNADGKNDLAFVTSRFDCSGGDCILVTVVDVLFGNENLPNFINFAFLNASNSSTIQFRNQQFAPVGNSVHLMNFNGDVNPDNGLPYADLLVMTSAETQPPELTTGFVISGFELSEPGTTICAGETGLLCNNSLWRIHTDSAYFNDAFEEVLDLRSLTTSRFFNVEAKVVGDVNGDGLEDVVVSWPYLTVINQNNVPPLAAGRAALLLGRPGRGDSLRVDVNSSLTVQGISLGKSVFELGDINNDGFDDFAISRTREDTETAPGALFVFLGKADYRFNAPTTQRLAPESAADFIIHHGSPGSLADGLSLISDLTVTAGDYNGDGKMDLAVGVDNTILTTGLEVQRDIGIILAPSQFETVDTLKRGSAHVFFSVADGPVNLYLDEADLVLEGLHPSDQFGTLPASPRIDLDHDGIDDLLVGAVGLDNPLGDPLVEEGGVYVIYGQRGSSPLPSSGVKELANFPIAGSGAFLVDRATGRPETFNEQLAENQSERWFRFTTLGDGQAGSHVMLTPTAAATSTTLRSSVVGALSGGAVVRVASTGSPFGLDPGDDGIIEFDISTLLGDLESPERLASIQLQLDLSAITFRSPGDLLNVSLLNGEGDGWVNSVDGTASGALLHSIDLVNLTGPTVVSLDVRNAVVAALLAGQTRITLRLEVIDPTPALLVKFFIQDAGENRPRLQVTRSQDAVIADLRDENGAPLAIGQSVFSLRELPAGTYYLRTYRAPGSSTAALPFSVSFVVPRSGAIHPETDHDLIRGGDGSDVLVGNHMLDRLFGQASVDSFTGEALEVRDLEAGESRGNPGNGELIRDDNFTPLDPAVVMPDGKLAAAIAQALGIPVTTSFTGVLLPARPLRHSDLARLTDLDLTKRGIVNLTGLDFATNLRRLYLGWNHITDVSSLQPELAGTEGAPYLETLVLDGNAISDLTPLSTLNNLRHLSLDFNPITNLAPLATLTDLEFLSIDGRSTSEPAAGGGFVDGYGLVHRLNNSSDGASALGRSVATMDNRIVIGAPNTARLDSQGQSIAGAGAVYVHSAITGELLLTINNPRPFGNDQFGASVATFGGKIIVGTPLGRNPNVITNPPVVGVVYVFDGATGQLLNTIIEPTPVANNNFGEAVTVVGSTIVVGSGNTNVGATSFAGVVYLYDAATGAPRKPFGGVDNAIKNPDPVTLDKFGELLSPLGDGRLLVGTFRDNSNNGAVYIVDVNNGSSIKVPRPATPASTNNFGQAVLGMGTEFLASAAGVFGSPGVVYRFNAAGQLLATFNHPQGQSGFGSSLVGVDAQTIAVTGTGGVLLFDYPSLAFKGTLVNPQTGFSAFAAVAPRGADLIIADSLMNLVYEYGQFDRGSLVNLDALAGLLNLRWLSLAGNDIVDVVPLASLVNLEHLNLSGNAIQDISPLADEFIVDDGDSGHSPSSNWLSNVNPVTTTFDHDYQYSTGQVGVEAEWVFRDLPDGTYDVQMTWPGGESHATQVRYTFGSGGSATVNQRLAPVGVSFGGQTWQSLGTANVTNGQLIISIANLGNGPLMADAARLVRIASTPSANGLARLSLTDNPLSAYSLDAVLPLIDSRADLVLFDANTQPTTLNPINAQFTALNTPLTLNLAGTFGDAGGDVVRLVAESSAPADVSVAIANNVVTATPRTGFTGTVRITVTAEDRRGGGRFARQGFDLHVDTGGIHGVKWHDLDQDGNVEAGEPLLEGWTVFLDADGNGLLNGSEPFTLTDVNGDYAFNNLSIGSHNVAEVLQPGWIPTLPRTPVSANFTGAQSQGFVTSGATNQWHLSTRRGADAGHTPSDAFYFGNEGTGLYSPNAVGTLTTPIIDLTNVTSSVKLDFNHFLAAASSGTLLNADFTQSIAALPSNDGFTATGLWSTTTGANGIAGHTTLHSFYFGQNPTSTAGGTVPPSVTGTIVSPLIDLTKFSGANVQLQFDYWLDSIGIARTDTVQVAVLRTGFPRTVLRNGLAQTTTFPTEFVDLSGFAGQQIQIEFLYTSAAGADNGVRG